MNAALIPLKPDDVKARLGARRAILVDIREPDEFARRHVQGALSRPLSAFEKDPLKVEPGSVVIFTCRTGMRTGANCQRLAAVVDGPAYVLDGGVDAWAAAGLPVVEDRKALLEIMRQSRSPPAHWCWRAWRSAPSCTLPSTGSQSSSARG